MTKRSVSYAALNIRLHPHSPEMYVDLMHKAFGLKRQVQLRGDSYGILRQIEPISDDPLQGLEGEIAKYTKIEAGSWFNLNELRAADEVEKKQIHIPPEMMPNFTFFNFVFFPGNHYLIIECKDTFGQLSPRSIEKFFSTLFNASELVDEFNKVEITLIPKTDQLDTVLSLAQINTLELVIRRPNADDLDGLEEEVLERLNRQHVAEETIKLKAQPGLSVVADEETRQLGQVAMMNGIVTARGRDNNGKSVEMSTQQHPLIETGQYEVGEYVSFDFLKVMADRIIAKIRAANRARIRNGNAPV